MAVILRGMMAAELRRGPGRRTVRLEERPGERRPGANAGGHGRIVSGSAVTRLHRFQGEHPDVQFTSPVMGRYGQYTALVRQVRSRGSRAR